MDLALYSVFNESVSSPNTRPVSLEAGSLLLLSLCFQSLAKGLT